MELELATLEDIEQELKRRKLAYLFFARSEITCKDYICNAHVDNCDVKLLKLVVKELERKKGKDA